MQINNPNQLVNQYRNDAAVKKKQTQWITIAFLKKTETSISIKTKIMLVDVYFIEPTHFGDVEYPSNPADPFRAQQIHFIWGRCFTDQPGDTSRNGTSP